MGLVQGPDLPPPWQSPHPKQSPTRSPAFPSPRRVNQALLDPRSSISEAQPHGSSGREGEGRGGISGLLGARTTQRLAQPPGAALPGRKVLGQLWAGSTLAWPRTAWEGVGPVTDLGPSPQPLRNHLGLEKWRVPLPGVGRWGAVRPWSRSARASLHSPRPCRAQLRPPCGGGHGAASQSPRAHPQREDPRAKETPLWLWLWGQGCPWGAHGCRTQLSPSLRPGAGTPPVPSAPITVSACPALGTTRWLSL